MTKVSQPRLTFKRGEFIKNTMVKKGAYSIGTFLQWKKHGVLILQAFGTGNIKVSTGKKQHNTPTYFLRKSQIINIGQ